MSFSSSYIPDEVNRPSLANAAKSARGTGFFFPSSRVIHYPRVSDFSRQFSSVDYTGGATSWQKSNRFDVRELDAPDQAEQKQVERAKENRRRSRRDLRHSVRGLGATVQMLTLATRDCFPVSERVRFGRAVKMFCDNTRHVIGAYVTVSELTKRGYCHAHLAVPDKTNCPAGFYSGYTVAELHELREIWIWCIRKCAAPSDLPAPGKSLGSVHMTRSRDAGATSGYLNKSSGRSVSDYMTKTNGRNVFFNHRFRSSRGLVRTLDWTECNCFAFPAADFSADRCDRYMMMAGDTSPYCFAVYRGLDGPAPPD